MYDWYGYGYDWYGYDWYGLDYPALDYPPWKFSLKKNIKKNSLKMGVSVAVTMDTGIGMFISAQTPIFTAVYQLSGWIKAWFILFDYPVYRIAGYFRGVYISRISRKHSQSSKIKILKVN